MVRNSKPYAKLAKGHSIIKDPALKDSPVQLIVADTDTQVVFLKLACATTATVISVQYVSGTALEVKTKSLFGFRDVFGFKHQAHDKFYLFGLDQAALKFTPFNFLGGEFGPLGKEKYITL